LVFFNINFNLGVIELFIGLGLLRHNSIWRIVALVSLWFDLIAAVLLCLFALGRTTLDFSLFGRPVGEIPSALGIIFAIAMFLLTLWQYRVLKRQEIKALFEKEPEVIPPEDIACIQCGAMIPGDETICPACEWTYQAQEKSVR